MMSNSQAHAMQTGNTDATATASVANAAHEVIDRAAQRAAEAERRVREAASSSAEKLEQGQQQAQAQLKNAVNEVSRYAQEKPLTTAGLAFAAGVVLTTLLRR